MLEPTPLYGGNADFLDALYEQYLRDPASVAARWRTYFATLGRRRTRSVRSPGARGHRRPRRMARPAAAALTPGDGADARQAAVSRLIQMWTNRGHLVASIDPLALSVRPRPRVLDLDYFGLTPADLESEFFTGSRSATVPEAHEAARHPRAAAVHLRRHRGR